jgi:ornithine cyclodeaminase/alanine dehydrogenase-like protein (mu-crystallin family)
VTRDTLILTAADVADLLGMADCIDAVERALAMHARGQTPAPAVAGVHTGAGGFHIKAAAADLGRFYFAAKTNGNFPGNPSATGLPTIQGIIVLCDASDGRPLAVLDSVEVTALRTGAATAVAARHLARKDSETAAIVGCGAQARAQLRALLEVLPLRRVLAVDTHAPAARALAAWAEQAMGVSAEVAESIPAAGLESDVIVTCTPSRRAFLGLADVRPGSFIAAVGADHPDKQEIEPDLLRAATVVVDSLEQCAEFGDLHHALAAGSIDRGDVRGELGQVVIGAVPGRSSDSETVVFDSTGTALQDVAAAALVYERAVEAGRGRPVAFAG